MSAGGEEGVGTMRTKADKGERGSILADILRTSFMDDPISDNQRCSVTFKMQQIHFQPGFRQRHMLGSYPHPLVSWHVWGKEGGKTNVCPGRHRPLCRH